MGQKGEGDMVPTPPKLGGRWWRVSCAGRNEVRLGRTGLVTGLENKNKKRSAAGFLFFPFFFAKMVSVRIDPGDFW